MGGSEVRHMNSLYAILANVTEVLVFAAAAIIMFAAANGLL